MSKYEISNVLSGLVLGVYEGGTEAEALDAMAIDAGYGSYAECCEVAPAQEGEILVRLVEDEKLA